LKKQNSLTVVTVGKKNVAAYFGLDDLEFSEGAEFVQGLNDVVEVIMGVIIRMLRDERR
jgi:hypothetical protein